MEGVLVRFGAAWKTSLGRLGAALGASWKLLGRGFRAPEASKTMCFTSVFGLLGLGHLYTRKWLLKRRLCTVWGLWQASRESFRNA